MRTLIRTALVFCLVAPGTLAAQVANPLAQSVGMGGNYTALARGLGAPAWNPAGLAMPDNPTVSFAFLPLDVSGGVSPLTPAHLAPYGGQLVPADVREEWVTSIIENGGEKGSLGADVTYLALNIGPVALSASSAVRGRVNMAPDVAKVLFFGNAGFTGDPEDLTLEGSTFDVTGTSTVAASFALPVPLTLGSIPDEKLAVGVTAKYTMGNVLMLGKETSSTLSANPVAVDIQFPVLHSPLPDSTGFAQPMELLNNGSGFGLDVGVAWQGGIFSAGGVVKNVINTFEWDVNRLQYREGTIAWNPDTTILNVDTVAVSEAPQELLDRIAELYTFSPILQAGAAIRILPFLTVTGELRHSLEDNLAAGVRDHVGAGAELTIIPFVPIRAGVAVITGGYQISGGAGLKLGPVQLSLAAAARETDLGADARGSLGLTFGVR